MIGDAVGETDPYIPYRWASSDFDFAANIGAVFIRPCDIIPGVSPSSFEVPTGLSVILMVGNPGSGKSSFARSIVGVEHIEQDSYPSRSKVLSATKKLLREGKSVVIDATYGNKDRRAEVYKIADAVGAAVRVVWLPRDGRPFNALREHPIPPVAYGVYTKHFSDPRDDGVPVTIIY